MLEGRIYKLLAGTYYVDTPMGAMAAKAKGSFRSESVLPRVGDCVRLESSGGAYRICEILPRRNCLLRPMVSNVDRLVIVLAVQKPLPDLMLLDGGKGHLSSVKEIMEVMDLDIPVFGMVINPGLSGTN